MLKMSIYVQLTEQVCSNGSPLFSVTMRLLIAQYVITWDQQRLATDSSKLNKDFPEIVEGRRIPFLFLIFIYSFIFYFLFVYICAYSFARAVSNSDLSTRLENCGK